MQGVSGKGFPRARAEVPSPPGCASGCGRVSPCARGGPLVAYAETLRSRGFPVRARRSPPRDRSGRFSGRFPRARAEVPVAWGIGIAWGRVSPCARGGPLGGRGGGGACLGFPVRARRSLLFRLLMAAEGGFPRARAEVLWRSRFLGGASAFEPGSRKGRGACAGRASRPVAERSRPSQAPAPLGPGSEAGAPRAGRGGRVPPEALDRRARGGYGPGMTVDTARGLGLRLTGPAL